MDIFKRVPSVLNTERKDSAVKASPDRTRVHEATPERERRVDKDTGTSRCVD